MVQLKSHQHLLAMHPAAVAAAAAATAAELAGADDGALAAAVGRPVITIRAWLKEGYLPASPYRLPTKKNINGEDHAGRRLYSRAMVEALVDIFNRAGLMETKRIEWSMHRQLPQEIVEAWNEIRANETKQN